MTRSANKKTGISLKVVIIAILAVLIAVAIFIFVTWPIKPEKFISVEFDDVLNGYSSAHLNVDYEQLDKMVGRKTMKDTLYDMYKDSAKGKKMEENGLSVKDYVNDHFDYYSSRDFFDIKLKDERNDLKNGDEVIVSIEPGYLFHELGYQHITMEEVNKMLRMKMPEEYKVTVSGLTEGTVITLLDPDDFAGWVSFSGVDGQGIIRIDYPQEYSAAGYTMVYDGEYGYSVYDGDERVGGFDILSAESTGKSVEALSKGDKVVFTLDAGPNLRNHLLEKMETLNNAPITITVNELGQQVSGLEILTDAQLTQLCRKAMIYAVNNDTPCDVVSAYKITVTSGTFHNISDSNEGIIYVISDTYDTFLLYQTDIYFTGGNADAQTYRLSRYSGDDDSASIARAVNNYGKNETVSAALLLGSREAFVGLSIYVNTDEVRVRKGPGTNYDHMEIDGEKQYYSIGSIYTILDAREDSDGRVWFKVEYVSDGTSYETWITSEYTDIR